MGRTDDMFVLRGINVFPSQIECAIAKVPELSPHYQITLTRDASFRDTALLEVELTEAAVDAKEQERILHSLENYLREMIIVRLNTVLLEPGTLERYVGKARRVDDRRYDME